jgi:hypothetical protein
MRTCRNATRANNDAGRPNRRDIAERCGESSPIGVGGELTGSRVSSGWLIVGRAPRAWIVPHS